jgi:hypothetical protein
MTIFRLQFSLIPLELFDKFIPVNPRGFCGAFGIADSSCPSINGQFARYRRCAKNLILAISTICLRLNFSRALISTKFAYFWMDTTYHAPPSVFRFPLKNEKNTPIRQSKAEMAKQVCILCNNSSKVSGAMGWGPI